MISSGWVKMHRQLLEWEWFTDSNTVHLFLTCLLKANHAPREWQGVNIESGQFVSSYPKLAEATGLSIKQVRVALNKLKKTGEVAVKTTNKFSIISITNWEQYQDEGSQVAVKGQAEGSQRAANKNEKNYKKKELDYSCWPSMPDEQILKDWHAMRKRMKANVSQTVINNFGKELHQAVQCGYSVNQCLSECVTRNWRGFKLEWIQNAKVTANSRSDQKAAVVDFIDQTSRAAATRLSGGSVQEVHSDPGQQVDESIPHGQGRTIEHE